MRALNQSYPGTAFLERRAPARMLSGNIKKQGGHRTQERVCQPCFLRATSDLQLETFFPCLAAPLRMSSGIAAYLIVLFSKALGAPGQSQPTSLPRTPGFLCLFLLTSAPPRSCQPVSNPLVACGFLSKAVGGGHWHLRTQVPRLLPSETLNLVSETLSWVSRTVELCPVCCLVHIWHIPWLPPPPLLVPHNTVKCSWGEK